MKTRFVGSVLRAASVAAIPLAALTISTPASAQRSAQRELFEWRGNVDQEIRVQMQGGRASVMAMGPREMTGYDNARAMNAVPPVNGYVTVQMRRGRGNADVVEQPSARNGYTTVVRIRDTQGGVGSYDVAAFWQPNGNVAYGDVGGYDDYGYPNQQRYPDRVTPNGGYQSGQAQPGKALPTMRGQSSRSGKALPGTDQSNPQNHRWPRGY